MLEVAFPVCGLDPVTLILKLDLDTVKMYDRAKNEVFVAVASKIIV